MLNDITKNLKKKKNKKKKRKKKKKNAITHALSGLNKRNLP